MPGVVFMHPSLPTYVFDAANGQQSGAANAPCFTYCWRFVQACSSLLTITVIAQLVLRCNVLRLRYVVSKSQNCSTVQLSMVNGQRPELLIMAAGAWNS